jgi:hypothetical protein
MDTSVPTATRTPSPPNSDTIAYYCGCPSYTQAVWTTDADSFTCGDHIEYIVSLGGALLDACRLIAGQEFPISCGPFFDPDVCQSIVVDNGIAVNNYIDGIGQPSMAAMQPTSASNQQPIVVPAWSILTTALPHKRSAAGIFRHGRFDKQCEHQAGHFCGPTSHVLDAAHEQR